MSRSVMVTGAAGQLGQAVVARLHELGTGVVAVDRKQGRIGGVDVVETDVTDPAAVTPLMAGCDAVIHLAAFRSPRLADAATVFGNNTRATFNVLTAAAEAGVRNAVIASSISMYGLTFGPDELHPRYVPIDEDHPITPYDPYALAKQADECTAAMVNRSTGMTIVALRLGWVATAPMIHERRAELAADPTLGKSVPEMWSYIEQGDAARALVAATDVDGGFNAVQLVGPDTLVGTDTVEMMAQYHPTTAIREPLTGTASAWSSSRAIELLGLGRLWSWRDPDAAPDIDTIM